MKKKNLILAALVLAGINCPTNSQTADFTTKISNNISSVGSCITNTVSKTLTPYHSFTNTALVSGAIGYIACKKLDGARAKKSKFVQGTVGHLDINPDKIEEVFINATITLPDDSTKDVGVTFTKWNDRKNLEHRQNFIDQVNNAVNSAFTTDTKATKTIQTEYTITASANVGADNNIQTKKLTLTPHSTIDLTQNMVKQLKKDDQTFGALLWDRVIKHHLVLASDCTTADKKAKKANEVFELDQFETLYKADFNNKKTRISAPTILAATPFVGAYGFFGAPTDSKAALGWAAAYLTACAIGKGDVFSGYGLALNRPTRKTENYICVRDQETFDTELSKMLLKESTNKEDTTFDAWKKELDKLKEQYRTNKTTTDTKNQANATLGKIKEHATKSEQRFDVHKYVELTDKVSGAKIVYAPTPVEYTTGALEEGTFFNPSNLFKKLLQEKVKGASVKVDDTDKDKETLSTTINNFCVHAATLLNPFIRNDSTETTKDNRRVNF